jgi:hypothetical protein
VYTVVVAISPQMRARHPEWPLSLEEALSLGRDPDPAPGTTPRPGRARWIELPGSLQAPQRARDIVRDTLHDWGMTALTRDAEFLASALIADTAASTPGQRIGLALREYTTAGGQPELRCEATSTAGPPAADPRPGPALVTSLAHASGRDITPQGTTTWFTLTACPQAQIHAPRRAALEHELEPGA